MDYSKLQKFISNCENDTAKIASDIASTICKNDIIAFNGSMGMGKTLFTRAFVTALGGGDVVSSPTFAIMNEYETEKFTIYHFDMYRVMSLDDLYSTGFFDFLETGAVMLIEWSENITKALPENTIYVCLELGENENQRIITVERK